MKNLTLFLILCSYPVPCFSYSTEASSFAEQKYARENCLEKVRINVKKEHTIKNLQSIRETEVPAIIFGYGDMKVKEKTCGKKKIRISYICLLDKNCKSFWSCINCFN